ncbi:ornithine carbamoyltransferase [Tyzzerella sp. OttesenSCG-928-J15]|nr:ornithine carbamoyltransferase [Tyzzerella sp. OttesenSCG-928-J15]
MQLNFKGKSLLTLMDFSKEEILYLVDLAQELKEKKKKGIFDKNLQNKNLAMIFEKPSTRTRCAFFVAASDEGANAEYLNKNDIQLGYKESVEDTARVLGRMFDGIAFRGSSQATVEKLAKYSGVPVFNGLTDIDHPTQILADFLTIKEHYGKLEGLKLVYVGDGRNNMANALMIGASKVGMNFTVAAPKELFTDINIVNKCSEYAALSGSKIEITEDIFEAVKGADIIYTDVWVSMGEESEAENRKKLLSGYQVNKNVMEATGNPKCIFLHCLPAIHNMEVTEEVFESAASLVFDEAENRMHTIKACLVAMMG